jgi:hypothetical protein
LTTARTLAATIQATRLKTATAARERLNQQRLLAAVVEEGGRGWDGKSSSGSCEKGRVEERLSRLFSLTVLMLLLW